jgi:hypothetical protein
MRRAGLHYFYAMEQGWDPEVKQFFKKIMSTISMGLLWLMAVATAGIYFELAWQGNRPIIVPIAFYVVATVSLLALIRYFYRLWKT